MKDKWISITCTNCGSIIGYDNDDYKEVQGIKCPYCNRWFYTTDAKIEVVSVIRNYFIIGGVE
jgi:hypothetical protein